jgi:hypothetical protein
MKVELERETQPNSGRRTVRLVASDVTLHAATIREWIKMLQLAERWLRGDNKR